MHDSDASSSELLDTMVADKINDYLDQPVFRLHTDTGQPLTGQTAQTSKFKKPPAKPQSLAGQLKPVLGSVLGESRRQ